jgi:hypothetical protein
MKILARSALMFLALAFGMVDPVDASVNTPNLGMVAEDSDADVDETDCNLVFQDDAALFSVRRKATSILTPAHLLDRPPVVPHVAGHHASSIPQYKLVSVFRI